MAGESRDYLNLVWKSPKTRRNYIVGKLIRGEDYKFQYSDEVLDALEDGFQALVSFSDINKTYQSEVVFPSFACRLPDKRRRGIEDILKKYGLTEYDEFELLKQSGARLPIDTFSFIMPIFHDSGAIDIKFNVMGVRHYIGCDGEKCKRANDFKIGQKLVLIPEPDNQHDKYAIKIQTENNEKVGYVPRYYNKILLEKLLKNENYICKIEQFNKTMSCDECVVISLKMPE